MPQSSSIIITSWATSTSLLVRYPELAVFKAVSARPFLAPCVEMKYCSGVRPSLKFAVIGVSIISPEGFAIRPLMPASCLICAVLPLAPESAIIKMLLNDLLSLRSSSENFLPSSAPSSFIISSAIFSVTLAHISITLLYRSPWVISPFPYCFCTSITSCSASLIISAFLDGMCISAMHMDTPDFVAYSNPSFLILSRNTTVALLPAFA